MRIAVIAATGRTGDAFSRLALTAGHEVIAVVRNPARLAFEPTEIAAADARSADQLALAIRGADAVVSTVGPGPEAEHGIMEESMRALLEAMPTAGVQRLLLVSASGPYTAGDNPLLGRVLKPIVQRILAKPFADIAATDALVQASALDWTIVRPPQLTGKAATGSYQRDPSSGMRITRGDLAHAMLDELSDPASVRRVVTVSN